MRATLLACCALLCGTVVLAGQAGGRPASQITLSDAPADENLEGMAVVIIRYPKDTHLAGWQLAHKLAYGAQGACFIKRGYWHVLAEAFESVGLTPEGKVETRSVGRHQVLISKVEEATGIKATLYLPEGLLQPLEGKVKLEALTSVSSARSTTQEVITWPTKVKLDYSNEPVENRTFEWSLVYNHARILNRTRSALRDENGNIIHFRDIKATKVQDTRDAVRDAGYFFGLAHGSRVGRVDLGVVGGME